MIAFLFPGQGSQRAGMYELLGDKANETDELFDIAKEATGRDVLSLCKDATDEELKQTYNTQLSVTAMNLAFATLLKHRGVTPDVVAGHSLGQLSALHEAGVLSTYDLFRLVNKRAELMSGLKESGKLATILGLEKNVVEAVCEETCQTTDQVRIALENSYKQYVIGGREADVDVAVAKMKEAGAQSQQCVPHLHDGAYGGTFQRIYQYTGFPRAKDKDSFKLQRRIWNKCQRD